MDVPDLVTNYCERNGWTFLNNSLLGKGTYGYVKVACKQNNCDYVAKVLELGDEQTEEHEFEAEIFIMLYLQGHDRSISPNIEEAWVCEMDGRPHGIIVMEKMDGTVSDLIKSGNTSVVLRDLPKMISKIKKLNGFGVIHGDLKADNILYKILPDGSYDYKLSDYGFSTRFEQGEIQTTNWLREFSTFEEDYDLAFFLCYLKKKIPGFKRREYISMDRYTELVDTYKIPHAWPC